MNAILAVGSHGGLALKTMVLMLSKPATVPTSVQAETGCMGVGINKDWTLIKSFRSHSVTQSSSKSLKFTTHFLNSTSLPLQYYTNSVIDQCGFCSGNLKTPAKNLLQP